MLKPFRLVLWAVLALASAPALAGEEARLAWIYVEANTGGSSGGHLGLRVEDTIYHVQQSPEGLYELNRDDWRTFRHLYAGLQNRTLELAELDVAAADVERVQERLSKAYVAQRRELDRRARRALDLAWLEAWRSNRSPPPLAGAGLLAPGPQRDPDAEALRTVLHAAIGADSLAAQLARVSAQIAAYRPAGGAESDRADPEALEALREALLLREALVAVEEAWPIAEPALLRIEGRLAEPLADAEVSGCRRFAEAQRSSVLELLGSQRPDRGRPLLLAMARHQALARCAASRRLVLLDAYAGEHDFPPQRELPRPAAWARLAADFGGVVRGGRTKVLARRSFDEAQYNLLEVGAGVLNEYERGARGEPTRKLPRHATPAPAGSIAFEPEGLGSAQLDAAIEAAEERYRRQQQRVHELYRYGVLRRNCVTELARLLNDAFEPDDTARALGARLEPGAGFGFIPFAFFDEVTSRLRVERLATVASHRERELARLLQTDPGLLRRLREAITLSSSIYTPRPRDGSFLFFSDDVFWRRPLLGFANFGYAAGSGVVGLVAAPFDGARRLRAAGSGLWYSLPELAFFNIRKGTFDWVPAEEN